MNISLHQKDYISYIATKYVRFFKVVSSTRLHTTKCKYYFQTHVKSIPHNPLPPFKDEGPSGMPNDINSLAFTAATAHKLNTLSQSNTAHICLSDLQNINVTTIC